MAKKNSKETLVKVKDRSAAEQVISVLPAAAFASIVILIVHLHQYTLNLSQFVWTPQSDDTVLSDFFSYYKMVAILVITIFAAIVFIVNTADRSVVVRKSKIYIPMAVFSFLALLSFLLSDYKEFALWGWEERFEGLITLLCYMLMLFIIMNCANTEQKVKIILWAFAVSCVLTNLLGLFQGLGMDLFSSEIGEKLISPSAFWSAIHESFANGEKFYEIDVYNNEVYQTVYNIDYVSQIESLEIPIFAALAVYICLKGKDSPLWLKIASVLMVPLTIYNLLGSRASGGYLGLIAGFAMFFIALGKHLKQMVKPLIAFVLCLAVLLGLTANHWKADVQSVIQSLNKVDRTAQTSEDYTPVSLRPFINNIVSEADDIAFTINGNVIRFAMYDDFIAAVDEEGNLLPTVTAEDGVTTYIDDERFYQYVAVSTSNENDLYFLNVITPGYTWKILPSNNGYFYVNDYGVAVWMDGAAESFGFEGRESFGTGRGYIWSRSLPLIKNTLLWGYGPDTFCIVFPQTDYVGKYNIGAYILNEITDKAHNLYIETAINTGLVSCIALIALYVMYIGLTVKALWSTDFFEKNEVTEKNEPKFLAFAGFGILIGCTSFMASCLVDDSSVSTMPMFYSMMGIGVAMDWMMLKEAKENKNKE